MSIYNPYVESPDEPSASHQAEPRISYIYLTDLNLQIAQIIGTLQRLQINLRHLRQLLPADPVPAPPVSREEPSG
jgi:hypothetical protein